MCNRREQELEQIQKGREAKAAAWAINCCQLQDTALWESRARTLSRNFKRQVVILRSRPKQNPDKTNIPSSGYYPPKKHRMFFISGKIKERPHWQVSCNFRWYLSLACFSFLDLFLSQSVNYGGRHWRHVVICLPRFHHEESGNYCCLQYNPFILTYKHTSSCCPYVFM